MVQLNVLHRTASPYLQQTSGSDHTHILGEDAHAGTCFLFASEPSYVRVSSDHRPCHSSGDPRSKAISVHASPYATTVDAVSSCHSKRVGAVLRSQLLGVVHPHIRPSLTPRLWAQSQHWYSHDLLLLSYLAPHMKLNRSFNSTIGGVRVLRPSSSLATASCSSGFTQ